MLAARVREVAAAAGGDAGVVSVVEPFTHGRALLKLVGADAARLLAKVCAVDLGAVADGTALRTSVARLATDVVRHDLGATPSYLLHCERSSGRYLHEALLDAGIVRLRPVLITVAATVIALFPLAAHGGPLWEPMCYAQIGGLTAAMFVTLIVVPVLYAIFVLDLKLVKWEERRHAEPAAEMGGAEVIVAAV